MEPSTRAKIVITGASGFLGGRLLKQLRQDYPQAQLLGTGRRAERRAEFAALGCGFEPADLLDLSHCQALTQGAQYVIHAAALSSPWGQYADFYAANVVATRNLLNAAQENGVQRVVLISTPSVYQNFRHRFNVREADPLPARGSSHYARTKLQAELMTLARNGQGLETIALRPRAIIGAEDAVIFPRVLRAYRAGQLRIIGNGTNVVDLTAVHNVGVAVKKCLTASASALGRAYNISNGEPVVLWEALNYLLTQLGLTPVTRKLPTGLALAVAGAMETWARTLGRGQEPPLTRQGISVLAHSLTMDISLARTQLGYAPEQSTWAAIDEFVAWYQTRPQ